MPGVPGFRVKFGDSDGSIEAGVLGLPWGAPDGESSAPEALGGIVVDEGEFPSISIGAGVPRLPLLLDIEGKLSIFSIASPTLAIDCEGVVN